MRLLLMLTALCATLYAQTPPCGRAIVTTGGSGVEDRFFPASPAHVKASVLRALPVVAAKPNKEDALAVEAKTDNDLYRSVYTKNREAGLKGFHKGMGAMGTFKVALTPTTENGAAGTKLHIEFHKNKFKGRIGNADQATPLMEETACLVSILSPADPQQNPKGAEGSALAGSPHAVVIPEGTPLKLTLREFLYSKKIKSRVNQAIVFEVTEDVAVDGATVIRKGALGTGKFIDAKAARGYRRSAELQFVTETVTAVDGQSIKISGATEKSRGQRKESAVTKVMTFSPALGWLDKGVETVIRAGTTYDAETAGASTVQAGR